MNLLKPFGSPFVVTGPIREEMVEQGELPQQEAWYSLEKETWGSKYPVNNTTSERKTLWRCYGLCFMTIIAKLHHYETSLGIKESKRCNGNKDGGTDDEKLHMGLCILPLEKNVWWVALSFLQISINKVGLLKGIKPDYLVSLNNPMDLSIITSTIFHY